MKLNLLRNTVHYASQYAWALSITMLPLAMVFSLEFTMPGWTVLLAVWLLQERMTPSRIGVVVLGLIGVLVILRPGIASFNPAAFLVLAAAFGYAITMIATKKLTMTETTHRYRVLDGGDSVSALARRQQPNGISPSRQRATFYPQLGWE